VANGICPVSVILQNIYRILNQKKSDDPIHAD